MKTSLFVLAIAISGCVTLTPTGQAVRVTNNPYVVKDCAFIGNVKASSGWGGAAGGGLGEDHVQIQMQNQTADLTGNVLFITSSISRATTRGIGEAYSCIKR
jgi:hypothetical protein